MSGPWRARLSLALVVALARLASAALGPRYGGDLTVGVLALPPTLDPGVPRGSGESMLSLLTQETLLRLDPDGEPRTGLARDWISAAGGREWSLRLPPGALFHDGQPIAGEDAARCVRRFLRSGSAAAARLAQTLDGGAAYRAGQTDELPGVGATGAEIVLRFAEAVSVPLVPLAAPSAAVVSPAGAGAGPFVPTANVPGRRLALTAFGAHVRGRPLLDRVSVIAVPRPDELQVELQTRRVTLVVGVGAWGAPAATLLLVLDPSRPPFDSAALRASVVESLAHSDLAGRVSPGAQRPSGLLPPRLWPPPSGGTEPTAPPAVRAGRPITLAVSAEVPPLVSQRLVAYLDDRGLRVEAVATPAERVLEATAHARLLLWSPEVPEPELALRELAAMGPEMPTVAEALAAAAREADAQRRRSTLLEAERALRASAVLIPLAVVPMAAQARANLHGLAADRAGRLVLEDAWLEP